MTARMRARWARLRTAWRVVRGRAVWMQMHVGNPPLTRYFVGDEVTDIYEEKDEWRLTHSRSSTPK